MVDGLYTISNNRLENFLGIGISSCGPKFEVKAAVCPKCHEVSYYMEDETFDRMKNYAAKIHEKQEKRNAEK